VAKIFDTIFRHPTVAVDFFLRWFLKIPLRWWDCYFSASHQRDRKRFCDHFFERFEPSEKYTKIYTF